MPNLTTRANFLANGLVPVSATTLATLTGEDLNCTVCSDALSEPVKTPCQHIFDKKCIAEWLEMPGENTCPSCREQLFSMPVAEPTNPVVNRQQQVFQAVRNAGLGVHQSLDLEMFGIPTPSDSDMTRAASGAAQYLIFARPPYMPQQVGPATVNAHILAAHVITMGNLIPALAALQNRSYSQRQQREWNVMTDRIYNLVLADFDGQNLDAMVMPAQLLMKMREYLQDVNQYGYGIDLGRDTDTLLCYLTQVSFQYRADEDRNRQQAARRAVEEARAARRQPRREGRHGSKQCAVM